MKARRPGPAVFFVTALLCGVSPAVLCDQRDIADLDIAELVHVRISPFDVSTALDRGYRASNAVSASRFDTQIQDLPFALQGFTESFIADQKPRMPFDVARYSPGVTYRSNDFNEGNANMAIRGFAIGSLAGGNVHILRDGFHGPSIMDMANVSRVEVVKGPASFLYGQLAPGGIVNVITKSPQSHFAANAAATYGAYGQYRVDADVTGPASRTLFYRVVAAGDHDMAYWKPYDAYSWNVAPSLLWQPSERLQVAVKYEQLRKRETPQLMQKPGYGAQTGPTPTPGDPNRSGEDVPGLPDNWNSMSDADFRNSDTRALNAWADWKASDRWNLRAGYSHLEYEVDALFSGNLGMPDNATLIQGRRLRRQVYSNAHDTWEVQALGRYAWERASLRALLGAQYMTRSFDRRAGQAPNDPALGVSPIGSPLPRWDLSDPTTWNRAVNIPLSGLTADAFDEAIDYTDRSVYAGATLGLLDERLLALAGWRWTSTSSRFTNRLAGRSDPRLDSKVVTPQFGVLYKLTPEVSVFASYAESFVPGTGVVRNVDGTMSAPKPTRGQGFDGGLKANLLDRRLSGTLTLFDIRNRNIVNDLASTDASGAVVIHNVQSGEQRSRGYELDATLALRDNWQLYLSYSRLHARITEFSGNDHGILAQDPASLDAAGLANYRNVRRFHNAPLQMSAPHSANLWTRYDIVTGPLRGVHLAGGLNYVRDQTLLPDSPPSLRQTYTLVNALVGYTWQAGNQHLTLELMGKNLGNAHYRPSQSSRSRPRELLLTLKARF